MKFHKNIAQNIIDFFKSSTIFCLLPIFLIFSFYPFIADPFLLPRALFLCVFIFFYVLFLIKTKDFKINFFSLAFFILAAFSLLSLFWSVNAAESMMSSFFYLFISLLMVFMQNVFESEKNKYALIKGLLISSFIIIFFIMFQLGFNQNIDIENIETFTFLDSPLGHKNITSGGLLLLLPFSFIVLLEFKRFYKFLAIFSISSSLFIIAILQTRSVYLSLILMFFVVLFGLVFYFYSNQRKAIQKKIGLIFGLFLVLFLLFFFINPFEFNVLNIFKTRLYSVFSFNQQFSDSNKTIHERIFLWKGTINIIQNHFFTGVGAGNWKLLFPFEGLIYSRAEQGQTIFQRPHNDFLWIFSELGFLGFIVYISIFIHAIFILVKNVLNNDVLAKLRLQQLIIFAGFLAYIVFANFSFPKERVFLVFLFIIYLSFLNKHSTHNFTVNKKTFLFLLVIVVFGFSLNLKSQRNIFKVEEYANSKQWEKVVDYSNRAESLCNNLTYTATPIAFYKGVAYSKLNENKNAQNAFLMALKHNPSHLQSINALAKTYEIENEKEKAFKIYDSALLISPLFYEAILNISTVSFQLHNYERCFHYLARLNPDQIVLDERYYSNLSEILVAIINDLKKDDLITKNAHNLFIQDANFRMKTFLNSGPDYYVFKNLLIEKSKMIN